MANTITSKYKPQSPADALATFLGIAPEDVGNVGEVTSIDALPNSNTNPRYRTAVGDHNADEDAMTALARTLGAERDPGPVEEDTNYGPQAFAHAQTAEQNYENAYKQQKFVPPPEQRHAEQVQLDLAHANHPDATAFPSLVGGPGAVTGEAGGIAGPVSTAAPAPAAGSAPLDDQQFDSRFKQIAGNLSPEAQGMLKQMLNYTYQVPNGSTAAKAFGPLVGTATQIDPTWEVNGYENSQKLRNDFISGPDSDRVRSINALAGHLDKFDQIRQTLGNYNTGGKPLNYGLNALGHLLGIGASGHGSLTDLNSTHGLVTEEITKLLAGANATDSVRGAIGGNITEDSPDNDLKGFIQTVKDMARPQIGALRSKANVRALSSLLDKALTPQARQMFGLDEQGSTGTGGAPAEYDFVNGQLVPRQ